MSGGIFWLASYPKSGNTWFRTFLQNLRLNAEEPVKINDLQTGSIASARAWIDPILGFDSAELDFDAVDRLRPTVYRWAARESAEIGYHKTHDAYTYLANHEPLHAREATLGALYLVRNPLDVAISLANHLQCDLDRAVAHMGNAEFTLAGNTGKLHHQVRQRLLSWSGHVQSWLEAPELNCLMIRYEDMHLLPLPTFSRAAAFLGLANDPERITRALRFSAFDELQRQETQQGFREAPQNTPQFFRQGRMGNWRTVLNAVQVNRIIADHGEMMSRLGYLGDCGNTIKSENTTHVSVEPGQ